MKSQLKAVGLRKSYHDKTVVDDVSLEIRGGEIVGLLGPNGAGKTTTFSMILGLVPQDAGRVFLDDEDITSLPMYLRARKGVCLLPQDPSAFRKLTVEENLFSIFETLPGESAGAAQASAILGELGLTPLAKARAFTLSGGERRRLEIARALATGPSFLLLDEPFTGIDPIAIQDLQAIIRSLKAQGLGILITDHAVRETLRICDRAAIIDKGVVFKSGTPEEIVASEGVRRTYLGDEFRL
ncbi:MAG: LPS export ABC transporter ATP-binding protein [Candidatus Aminicenantes bacterium]|nr:LPS export ABC transporter ATP-binding protein [Candidatus Aminicenantes bacterium]